MEHSRGCLLHPDLKTDRLIIRRIAIEDAALIFTLRNVKETSLILDWPCYTNISQACDYIRTRCQSTDRGECFYWTIVLKSACESVGTICLWNFNQSTAEIGYELLPAYQGSGIMSEAVKAVLKFAFSDGGFDKIEALPYSINPKSVSVLARTGFKFDGTYEISHSNRQATGLRYIITAEMFISI